MRILIATDGFKGSLTSIEAGAAVAAGLREGFARLGVPAAIDVVPTADGGDGTVEAFYGAGGGRKISVTCPGPLGDPVSAEFLLRPGGKTAVIETARSSGLTLVEGRRDILRSDTSGLGRQIEAALEHRPENVLIGLGGSATNDWGAGMAAALGARFLDGEGRILPPRPAALSELRTVETAGLNPRLQAVRFEVLADVDNPLLGPHGAAAVFAPQKGADAETVGRLEETGRRFADAVEAALGRKYRDLPGAGAAGGLGFGTAAFLGAVIRRGVETIIEATGLKEKARRADLVVTGEGRLDFQSRRGKTADGIARLARELKKPCVAFCGSIDGPLSDYVPGLFAAAYAIRPEALSLEDAIRRGAHYLETVARRAAREIAALAAGS
ncbi:MAG TPA: glycerate kinase [Candidatus Aminicenantes bacterium]|nr:glycerate kinase [Candidatus Aminicenantes bacterium]HPH44833.1 glycerate kinase [Candidatus Aminicenantes bacterium]